MPNLPQGARRATARLLAWLFSWGCVLGSSGQSAGRRTGGLPSPQIKAGLDHVDPHPGRDLPAIPQGRYHGLDKRVGKAMIEAATALLVFLSIGVFLAHAFDAYRMR